MQSARAENEGSDAVRGETIVCSECGKTEDLYYSWPDGMAGRVCHECWERITAIAFWSVMKAIADGVELEVREDGTKTGPRRRQSR